MKLLRTASLLLPLILCVACLPRRASRDEVPRDTPAVLHPGDSLRVAVWRNPELSGSFLVAEDGTLRHPLYQAIHVAELPLDTVYARIATFLLQFTTTPLVTVEPQFRVVVRGEVRTSNAYTMPLETTLGGAIAMAGGPYGDPQLRDVTLVRDQRTYHLDFSDPAAAWTVLPIRSRDQIIIGRKSNLFFGTILPLITASAAIASLISVLRRN